VFGKRSGPETDFRAIKPASTLESASGAMPAVARSVASPPAVSSPPLAPARAASPPPAAEARRSDTYYQVKATIFGALIEAIDLAQLSKLDGESAREEIRDIVNEIIAIKNIVMSIAEQEDLLDDICNDVPGYGPLEPLLARDEIADIMTNGSGTVYIEVGGKIQKTGIRFRDNQQLLNICQRIVSQVGRRSTRLRPSATRACRTARASTPSCRRLRSTGRRSPSANSVRTSRRSSNWSAADRSRRKAPRSSR
jgi:pilus assembly protein CpaF